MTTGIAAVVRPAIENRPAWAGAPEGADAGSDHALRFANSGNEARAITLVYETALEKLGEASGVAPDARLLADAVARACKAVGGRQGSQGFHYANTYLAMKDLRNDLVHLRPKSRQTRAILASPANFRSSLTIYAQVLRKTPPKELDAEIIEQFARLTRR